MIYIELNDESFLNEEGYPSIEYLSQYCEQLIATKISYTGSIFASRNPHLKFNNIVKAKNISTYNIVDQFPDLEETYDISYYTHNAPNIGNLKSTCRFYMPLNNCDREEKFKFIKKYIKFIDKNTLIINNKELKISGDWTIGPISELNYSLVGF